MVSRLLINDINFLNLCCWLNHMSYFKINSNSSNSIWPFPSTSISSIIFFKTYAFSSDLLRPNILSNSSYSIEPPRSESMILKHFLILSGLRTVYQSILIVYHSLNSIVPLPSSSQILKTNEAYSSAFSTSLT